MPVSSGPRVPPRFVPTLTEVVREGGQPPAEQSAKPAPPPVPVALPASAPPPVSVASALSAPLAASRIPLAPPPAPPTPVQAQKSPSFAAPKVADVPPAERAAQVVLSKDFEELLVHRVMQRVDVSLDIRLRGAIAAVVEEQTRSIVPRLREEIEAVVRHAVYEAVADELAAGVGTPPA